MSDKLTHKQEKFAQKVVETGNQSEAYRQAFGAENYTDKSIHEKASQLANTVKVKSRIQELQEEAAYIAKITRASLIKELEDVQREAKTEAGDQGRRLQRDIINDKAKLAGLAVEKKEVEHTGAVTITVDGTEGGLA